MQRRLALERALPHELAEVELGDVDQAEAEVDAREDVARVVADDAGAPAGPGEARRERVEVAGALLPAREHRADAVVVGVAARQERDPRRERARERDVGAIEARAASRRAPPGAAPCAARGGRRAASRPRGRRRSGARRWPRGPAEAVGIVSTTQREGQRGPADGADVGEPPAEAGQARRPLPPPRRRAGDVSAGRQQREQRDAAGPEDVRREDLDGAPEAASPVPGVDVERRVVRHAPELHRPVQEGDEDQEQPCLARDRALRVRLSHAVPERHERPRRPPEQRADDDRRREDRDADAPDLRAEPALDERLDLPGLRASRALVDRGALRRPRGEHQDVRRADERRVRDRLDEGAPRQGA